MKIVIEKNYSAMSKTTGKLMSNYIRHNSMANLCLPTGGSVEGVYECMCKYLKAESISLSEIKGFNMDEYATLSKDDVNGYYYFLRKNIYSKTDIDISNTFAPATDSKDLQLSCEKYTDLVAKHGGFDFILLGIGSDGHIAFNMPRNNLHLDTHIENLTEDTIEANSRFFEKREDIPKQALSIGVGMIMQSKKIVLVASGKGKSKILGKMFNYRILDPKLPATALWLHPDVTFILDEEAASDIEIEKIKQYF